MDSDCRRAGVKYCGGCNPRYDRSAVVQQLRAQRPELRLCPASPGEPYQLLFVVCGCASACADIRSL